MCRLWNTVLLTAPAFNNRVVTSVCVPVGFLCPPQSWCFANWLLFVRKWIQQRWLAKQMVCGGQWNSIGLLILSVLVSFILWILFCLKLCLKLGIPDLFFHGYKSNHLIWSSVEWNNSSRCTGPIGSTVCLHCALCGGYGSELMVSLLPILPQT